MGWRQCHCPKLRMVDCSDACLVPGGPIAGFYNRNPSYWSYDKRTYTFPAADTELMTEQGGTAAEFATVKDEPWEYNFGVADSAKDTLAQGTYLTSTGTAVSDAFARRHLASRKLASTETAIEIQCGSSCATVEALIASDSFESTMEAKGETVVVAKDSMLTYDSASSAIGSVTTVVTGSPTVSPTDSPVTTTTTETVTVTESDDDYKTIAIVFIIVSVILLIAVIALAATRGGKGNGAGTKFEDTDAALASESYEV